MARIKVDLTRLQSQLLTSGLQQSNNALYQVINQLILAVLQGLKEVSSFSSSGGSSTTIINGGNGVPGLSGEDGESGPPGIRGIDGATGPAGADGIPGIGTIPGNDGLDGLDGFPGPVGPQGETGLTGPQGVGVIPGNDGEDGIGFPGIQGPQGNIGETGPMGIPGFEIPGNDGIDGMDGIPGPVGPMPSITTSMGITIDGGGTALTTGIKGDLFIPVSCTIVSVTMLADQSGSIVIDIWKDAYANYPPTVADTITAAAKPTITTDTKSQDTTLTGWTVGVTAGDTLRFNVDSITTITRVNLSLKISIP